MLTKGWGPWRYDWYSFCSRHREHDADCSLCRKGRWVNHWKRFIGSVVYEVWPELWRWWANR